MLIFKKNSKPQMALPTSMAGLKLQFYILVFALVIAPHNIFINGTLWVWQLSSIPIFSHCQGARVRSYIELSQF